MNVRKEPMSSFDTFWISMFLFTVAAGEALLITKRMVPDFSLAISVGAWSTISMGLGAAFFIFMRMTSTKPQMSWWDPFIWPSMIVGLPMINYFFFTRADATYWIACCLALMVVACCFAAFAYLSRWANYHERLQATEVAG